MPRVQAAQCPAVAQYSNALADCQPNLLRQVYGASKLLIHRLFPATCLLCLDPGQRPALDLCKDCEDDLPGNVATCGICAAPVAVAGVTCDHCMQRRPAFDRAFAPYRYEFPMVELIHRLKYGGQVAIATHSRHAACAAHRGTRTADGRCTRAGAASSMRAKCSAATTRRARSRDSRRRSWRSCRRSHRNARSRNGRAGGASGHRAAGQRQRRVRGSCAQSVPASVAIVDDVLTTGATVDALARVLRLAGCRHIEVWAVARAGRLDA